jgi:hypothetical protein
MRKAKAERGKNIITKTIVLLQISSIVSAVGVVDCGLALGSQ